MNHLSARKFYSKLFDTSFSKTYFPVFCFNININDIVFSNHKLSYGTKDHSEMCLPTR